jgi:NAD(P)-dependent dehydrogenase (short-subunit alcohol dehydrogenase family)
MQALTKVLIITGASRGIGNSVASTFINDGWQVLNLSRHPCSIEQVTNHACDLSVPGWEIAASSTLQAFLASENKDKQAKICLVHNAACLEKDSVDTIDPAHLRHIFEVNLVAPTILNRLVLPYMQSGSAIIYIGSTLSEKAVSGAFSYVTSKHAIAGIMRATCQDLAGTGIHTVCVCPGFTDTPMLLEHLQHDKHVLQQITAQVTAKRLIQPQEIAECVLFCAEHSVLNGAMIHANLGQIET